MPNEKLILVNATYEFYNISVKVASSLTDRVMHLIGWGAHHTRLCLPPLARLPKRQDPIQLKLLRECW